MTYTIPDPIEIACTACLQLMRVEKQRCEANSDRMILALECGCGRRLATLDFYVLRCRNADGRRFSSEQLESLEPDQLAAAGLDVADRARDLMRRSEDYIGMATWARDGKRR